MTGRQVCRYACECVCMYVCVYVCTSLMNLFAKTSPLPFSSSVDPSPTQRNTCVYVSSRNTSSDRTGQDRTGQAHGNGEEKREGEEECKEG